MLKYFFDKNKKHIFVNPPSGDGPINMPPICVPTFDSF